MRPADELVLGGDVHRRGAGLDGGAGPAGDVGRGDVVGERLALEVVPAPRRPPASAVTSASWTASMTSSSVTGSSATRHLVDLIDLGARRVRVEVGGGVADAAPPRAPRRAVHRRDAVARPP